MREAVPIHLTNSELVAWVDEDVAPLVLARSWRPHRSNSRVYARASWTEAGKTKSVMLHRLILGAGPGQFVDHIDGDPMNNRRSNLRFATIAENNRNSSRRRSNRSGVKGVVQTRARTWQAMISVDGRNRYLGTFPTQEEAAAAYDAAARAHYGEFARLNAA